MGKEASGAVRDLVRQEIMEVAEMGARHRDLECFYVAETEKPSYTLSRLVLDVIMRGDEKWMDPNEMKSSFDEHAVPAEVQQMRAERRKLRRCYRVEMAVTWGAVLSLSTMGSVTNP
jgi:hypothetical protein